MMMVMMMMMMVMMRRIELMRPGSVRRTTMVMHSTRFMKRVLFSDNEYRCLSSWVCGGAG
jgi:hypothetical protein